MKCPRWGNPSHLPNSEPWLNQSMVAIGNEKKKLIENVVVSLRRTRPTNCRVNLPCRTKATRTNIRRSCLLCATPVHPLRTLKKKSWNWMTKSGKMVNLLSRNEHVALQIIFAFSAEVSDILPKNAQNSLPLPRKPKDMQQKESLINRRLLWLRTRINSQQPFGLRTDHGLR